MKTGFIHGFCNKPLKKYYSYHGEIRDCLIDPDPPPFLPVDTNIVCITETFLAAYSNECRVYSLVSYLDAHDRLTAGRDGITTPTVGQKFEKYPDMWTVFRVLFYFNTMYIPDEANILSAKILFYAYEMNVNTPFDLVIQNGQPIYPHYPYEEGDYYHGHYSGVGGSIGSSEINVGGWNEIILDPSWIYKTQSTRLVFRISGDINSVSPGPPPDFPADTVRFGGATWETRTKLEVKYTV